MFRKGVKVSKTKLVNAYKDPYALEVLEEMLEEIPDKNRVQMYRTKWTLPDKEAFLLLKQKKYTVEMSSLLEEAFSEIEELGNELEAWYDNMPENTKESERAYTLEQSKDDLQNIQPVILPKELENTTMVYYPSLKPATSRASRASVVEGQLRAVAEELNEIEGHDDLIRDIEEAADALSSVEFPGMFG